MGFVAEAFGHHLPASLHNSWVEPLGIRLENDLAHDRGPYASDLAPALVLGAQLIMGVLFGLAMDYQVFLVTRMREEFVHGLSTKEAIVAGYRHGARVVTSAAIIMISVFAAFMLAPDTTSKMIGFTLAAAVLFDAFVIRMMVVPGLIALLGDRAWSLPKWLDRFVIDFDIEGADQNDAPSVAMRSQAIAKVQAAGIAASPMLGIFTPLL